MPVKLVRKKALSNSTFFQSPTVHFGQIYARGLGVFNIDGTLLDVSAYIDIDTIGEWQYLAGENSAGAKGDALVVKKLADDSWQLEVTQYYATQADYDAASVPADQTFADADLPTNILGTGTEPSVVWNHNDNQPRLLEALPVLRAVARQYHAALEEFMERLISNQRLHNSKEVQVVRNHVAYAHFAGFLVGTKNTTANGLSDLSIRQRINFFINSRLGPKDITNVADLSDTGRQRTRDEIFLKLPRTGGVLNNPPTTPRVWVDPRTGKRIHIAFIEGMSHGMGSVQPTGYDSATTGLNLNAVAIPATFSHSGAWINTEITS